MSTKKKFYFFNAHFDHQGVVARRESSKLILQKIKAIAGDQQAFFTGDLNGGHKTEWYQALANSDILKDTYRQAKHPYANNGSFNGFGATIQSREIIDHIFSTNHFSVLKWGVLTDSYHGKYPSDHFPILAVVAFK